MSDSSVACAGVEDDVAVQQSFRNSVRLVIEHLRPDLDCGEVRGRDRAGVTRVAVVLGALLGQLEAPRSRGGLGGGCGNYSVCKRESNYERDDSEFH